VIQRLLAEDRRRGIWWIPIRHHSPACALQVRRVIESVRPKSVMIEGPDDLTPLIPHMLDPRTRAPFAAYCTHVDAKRRIFGGYYPFCDYSPELVALRSGRAAGAALSFIDLTYPEKILTRREERSAIGMKIESQLEEMYLKESAYLDRLAKQTGCRDHDELWDHLFEMRSSLETERFIDEVAVYCAMSRATYSSEAIAFEGNLARERNMAAHVAAAIDEGRTPIVVVTGGFHTVHLPLLVREKPARRTPPERAADSLTVLMRYGFDQLDALNGYSAGMPAPAYYDRVWHHLDEGIGTALAKAAVEVLVDLSRETRARRLGPVVSTAQAIDAVGIATQLAKMRGHPGPSREDVLDAVRSCFVKGALDAEGSLVMAEVEKQLAGKRVGFVPPEAGVPPIAADFHRLADELRLDVSQAVRRESALDLYRKAAHRKTSRFFHALTFLGVPFAELIAGPDFAAGTDLDRIQEVWSWCWTPEVESSLIERMAYGATIAEAAGALLLLRIVQLEQRGAGRSARAAVSLLIAALRMGLFDHVDRIALLIEEVTAEDPSFGSVVDALGELVLLESSREPLEAFRLPRLGELSVAAYRRATYLIDDLGGVTPEREREVLGGLSMLRGLLSPSRPLDPALLYDALLRLLDRGGNGAITGGAAGLLFSEGLLGEERLLALLIGHLGGGGAARNKTAFLRGLLSSAREIAWRVPGFVRAVTDLLAEWEEEDFLGALPELRLAFADLTPKETDRLAALVGRDRGRELGEVFVFDVSAEEVQANLRISERARSILERDGLEGWAE
jgi:hypothetical protein